MTAVNLLWSTFFLTVRKQKLLVLHIFAEKVPFLTTGKKLNLATTFMFIFTPMLGNICPDLMLFFFNHEGRTRGKEAQASLDSLKVKVYELTVRKRLDKDGSMREFKEKDIAEKHLNYCQKF